MSPFWGKYRGTVTNNFDPQGQGRLQVSVPAVLGEGRLSWALPSVPYAGPGLGFLAIPPLGANIWVEFEGGDPDFPIWSGCFWDLREAPNPTGLDFIKVFKTDSITLTLDDTPGAGGFTLEVNPPAVSAPIKLACTSSGIEISTGAASVKLTPASVSINNGALEVI